MAALALDINNESAYSLDGDGISTNRKGTEAIAVYEKAIEIDPKYTRAYNRIGFIYHDQNNYEEAIEWYNKAIEIDPTYAVAYENLGRVYYDQKNFVEAIKWYKKAIEIDPKLVGAYNNIGIVYDYQKNYEEAIKWYNKAIEIDPKYVNAYNNLGLVYYDQKNFVEAIKWFSKAIEIDPKSEDAYNNTGLAYAGQKKYKDAIKWFSKAIEIAPKSKDAYHNIGVVYANKEKYEEAIKWSNKAIEIDPKYARPYINIGAVYEAQNNYDEALIALHGALEIYKNSPHDGIYIEYVEDRIAEIEKKIKDAQYGIISGVADKIKELLLHTDGCVTHYTSFEGTQQLILADSPFRLSEGSFLNDPTEGRTLYDYLKFHPTREKAMSDTEAKPFAQRPFIGSFVAESKNDDLALWRMYGKDKKEEARGCAITMHAQQLVDAIKAKLMPSDKMAARDLGEDFSFYRVAYITPDGDFIIPHNKKDAKTGETESELKNLLDKLKTETDKLNVHGEKNKDDILIKNVLEKLNSIAYLFKSAEYQYEYELRLVIKGTGFDRKYQESDILLLSKVYIDTVVITPSITRITLGPKVERAEEWASYLYYRLLEKSHKPDIFISRQPFK